MDRCHDHSRYRNAKEVSIVSRPDPQLLDEIVKRVTDAVHPVRIVLFGSAARGDMGPNADLDLLVVMPDGTHRREASRVIFWALRGLGMSKDIVVATEQDIRQYGDNPSLVLKPALEEGKELYRAAG
ncbi:MAG: nucleotidyltransferase domain-containing protein [Deltaproteobacteria bacterium]|jgi:predicted nucleotidyltransferase|nr:nucleotidyltransferase domain-containing protein [Deltaproteobacteria bacterium]